MAYTIQFQKLLQIGERRWLLVICLVATMHLFFQSLLIPYRNALLSLLPHDELPSIRSNALSSTPSSSLSVMNNSIFSSVELIHASLFTSRSRSVERFDLAGEMGHKTEAIEEDDIKESKLTPSDKGLDDDSDFIEDADIHNDLPFEKAVDIDEISLEIRNLDHSLVSEGINETTHGLSLQQIINASDGNLTDFGIEGNRSSTLPESSHLIGTAFLPVPVVSTPSNYSMNRSINALESYASNSTPSAFGKLPVQVTMLIINKGKKRASVPMMISKPVRKKMRCEMPPKSIMLLSEMNRLLVRLRARSRAMRPRWSSARDQEILAAKLQILNAPILKSDQELYAPLFRNVSMFKRSYELMERILKIYVYKDGVKPIFHQPILKGLYASEGWFMKLMEENKQFLVKDPRKAHLYYMPFSSRMLEHTLYVRNSHNRTNLRSYLKGYAEKIAAKYRFWNRTGGADHFLVACHDWAPYETRHHMEHCIKALCNADVTQGFKIGRDVSLPEAYVRSARNPLRDLGGKPPSKRHSLAFYAGSMHGYLRPILLKHWLNKDADMEIFGPMPSGVASKMNYIQHMQSSKFCICPKGYEVNSPRVVEAIFYECVPVIISDNFVPPFFEVLNWEAFSVILAEKDIPELKNILLSISREKYLELQLGVRKVQKHFLWHPKPVKYDLFHMTLHSIWFNRVFQVKAR